MPDIPNVKMKNGTARIEVDTGIYNLDAVLTSAYHYIDDFYVYIDQKKQGGVGVELTPKNKMSEAAVKKAAAGFHNILLAETLRLKIHKQNRKFREEMLEKAIASALSPQQDEIVADAAPGVPAAGKQNLELDAELKKIIEKVKTMDYRDDPLGIAVPVPQESFKGKPSEGGKKKS